MTLKSKVLKLGSLAFNCLYNGLLPIAIFAAPDPEVNDTVLINRTFLLLNKSALMLSTVFTAFGSIN